MGRHEWVVGSSASLPSVQPSHVARRAPSLTTSRPGAALPDTPLSSSRFLLRGREEGGRAQGRRVLACICLAWPSCLDTARLLLLLLLPPRSSMHVPTA